MKNYLPIGSVVHLYNASSDLMIIGINMNNEDANGNVANYDYLSVRYPEGYLSKDDMYLFNTSDIEDVHFLGCDDDKRKEYLRRLSQQESQIENSQPEFFDL